MTRFFYGHGMVQIGKGNIDLEGGAINITLLMSNTTCDTEVDKLIMGPGAGGFTTIDEFDGKTNPGGVTFPTGGEALSITGWVYTTTPSRRARLAGLDHTFTNGENYDNSLTGRQISAYLIYADLGTGFANGVPLVYDDGPVIFDFDPGTDFIKISPSTGSWFFAQSNPTP